MDERAVDFWGDCRSLKFSVEAELNLRPQLRFRIVPNYVVG